MAAWLVAVCAGLVAGAALDALFRQRELVARAAHELRGPLTAIALALDAGIAGALTRSAVELELERAKLALDDLDGCAVRWHGGVRRRRRARELERVELRELLTACVRAAQPCAQAAGVAVCGAWEGPAAFLWGERVRLVQALGNLIANAIEHGEGTVEVRGVAEPALVRIEVRDEGRGLPAPLAELARRARGGRGRGRRGRGLAIAAAIVEQHRGRVAAAPSGTGARVVVELPAWASGAAGRERR